LNVSVLRSIRPCDR